VWLGLADGYHNKEYRIVVDGCVTVFQWGRQGASGQVKRATYPTAEAALDAAYKQWAAKEAKGYWPISGIVNLAAGAGNVRYGDDLVWNLDDAHHKAVGQLTKARVGDRLWLCQVPYDHRADWRRVVEAELVRLGHAGGTLSEARNVKPREYVIVSVGPEGEAALKGACPVAVALGSRKDAGALVVGEISAVLAQDVQDADGSREALAVALEAASAIADLSC
jgi:predicted DNA-binding WGR domain protein